jgi:hypothetical protein
LKQDIEKVGTACVIALIRTSLPPTDRSCPTILEFVSKFLSFRYSKAQFLDLPTSVGIPTYFSLSDSLNAFNVALIIGASLTKNE